MADITHLKITRRDRERAYAPAVARVLNNTHGIKATPRGWQIAQDGDAVTLTSFDAYMPAATLARRLMMLAGAINESRTGPTGPYWSVGY